MRDAHELLYAAADAVQFLSPAHQRVITQLIRVRAPQHVVAAPIDLDRFRATTPVAKRPPRALILGDAIRVADGAERRARRRGYEPERISYLSISYDEMPALFNRYQAVVVDPVMFHAFGRVAVEAMACGCEVLASERVGALSWPDPMQAAREANERFWQIIARGCNAKPRRRRPFARRGAA